MREAKRRVLRSRKRTRRKGNHFLRALAFYRFGVKEGGFAYNPFVTVIFVVRYLLHPAAARRMSCRY